MKMLLIIAMLCVLTCNW